jgi:hypothetical protein
VRGFCGDTTMDRQSIVSAVKGTNPLVLSKVHWQVVDLTGRHIRGVGEDEAYRASEVRRDGVKQLALENLCPVTREIGKRAADCRRIKVCGIQTGHGGSPSKCCAQRSGAAAQVEHDTGLARSGVRECSVHHELASVSRDEHPSLDDVPLAHELGPAKYVLERFPVDTALNHSLVGACLNEQRCLILCKHTPGGAQTGDKLSAH